MTGVSCGEFLQQLTSRKLYYYCLPRNLPLIPQRVLKEILCDSVSLW
jgi:hypothetical protein